MHVIKLESDDATFMHVNYKEAIEDFTKAIKLKPHYTSAYNGRDNAKGNLGRYEEAIEDYDETLDINPYYAGTYHNRGLAKAALGRHEEAIADYDKAIVLQPDHPDISKAYYNRGNS